MTSYCLDFHILRNHFIVLLLLTLLIKCGGVVGSIEVYKFNYTTYRDLKKTVTEFYEKHPDMITSDPIFKIDTVGDNYYCVLKEGGRCYMLNFKIVNYGIIDTTWNDSAIALIRGGECGKALRLAKELNYFEKNKFRKLFESNIIKELYEEVPLTNWHSSH